MDDKEKRMTVGFPETLKRDLEKMSSETGISQVRLISLATHALVANYNEYGTGIFSGLLNVAKAYKENKKGDES